MAKLRGEDVMAADVMERRGRSIRSLARDFEVDESTLRYRLGRLRSGVQDGRKRQREACADLGEAIGGWIQTQRERAEAGGRPEPVKALYEQLVVEDGYTGSYKSVLRYVRRRRGQPRVRPTRRVDIGAGHWDLRT